MSCSVVEWGLAAAEAVGVAVGGFTLEKSVESMGWLVCGLSCGCCCGCCGYWCCCCRSLSGLWQWMTCGMAVGVHFVWCMHIPGISGKVVVLLGCRMEVGGCGSGGGGGSDGDGGSLRACSSVRSRGRW